MWCWDRIAQREDFKLHLKRNDFNYLYNCLKGFLSSNSYCLEYYKMQLMQWTQKIEGHLAWWPTMILQVKEVDTGCGLTASPTVLDQHQIFSRLLKSRYTFFILSGYFYLKREAMLSPWEKLSIYTLHEEDALDSLCSNKLTLIAMP